MADAGGHDAASAVRGGSAIEALRARWADRSPDKSAGPISKKRKFHVQIRYLPLQMDSSLKNTPTALIAYRSVKESHSQGSVVKRAELTLMNGFFSPGERRLYVIAPIAHRSDFR